MAYAAGEPRLRRERDRPRRRRRWFLRRSCSWTSPSTMLSQLPVIMPADQHQLMGTSATAGSSPKHCHASCRLEWSRAGASGHRLTMEIKLGSELLCPPVYRLVNDA